MNDKLVSIPTTPKGRIKICKTKLENDYKNSLTFESLEKQKEYFDKLDGVILEDYNYIRKDGVIKVGKPIDELINYNYLYYKNTDYSNKIYYCFIKDLQFVNTDTTALYIETDVIQTYHYDVKLNESFVEREHTNNDTPGFNTIPENVECGQYVQNYEIKDDKLNDTALILASTVTPSEGVKLVGGEYQGIYSGVKYYTYDAKTMTSNLQFLADESKIDGVSALFMAPKFLANNQGGIIEDTTEPNTYNQILPKLTKLNGYTPKNKKLLTYPFCYLEVSNANGANAIFHQELFTNNEMTFKIEGSLTPGCSIRTAPINYKGGANTWDYGINAGKFPQLNWATDQFVNWCTQNGVNVATSLVSAGLDFGASYATGDVKGGVSSVMSIANTVRQVQLAEKIPPQAGGNLNCGDIATSSKENTFHYYGMSIKSEFAQIIDNFFSMFGYATHRVKAPNIFGRRNWNYVKTLECNFDGNIPQNDLRIIKNIFNNGITLWHNPDTMYDYSQNNDII